MVLVDLLQFGESTILEICLLRIAAPKKLRGEEAIFLLPGGLPGGRNFRRDALWLAGGPMGAAADDGADDPLLLGVLRANVLFHEPLGGRRAAIFGGDGCGRRVGGGGGAGFGGFSQARPSAGLRLFPCDERTGNIPGLTSGAAGG